jgi:hypothetical protein
VGVDVEAVRTDLEIAELAAVVLTPDEHDLIDSLPPERRPECFAALWTRKEALAKATGLGLRLPFARLDVGGFGDAATWSVCDDQLPDGRDGASGRSTSDRASRRRSRLRETGSACLGEPGRRRATAAFAMGATACEPTASARRADAG